MMSTMPASRVAKDNLFGVCHAIGTDFGFDPLYLRILLAAALMARPEAVLIGYASAALLVLASRVIVRAPARAGKTLPEPIRDAPLQDVGPLALAA